FRVLAPALADGAEPLTPRAPVLRSRELIALALALCSALLGLLPLKAFDLLQMGRPHASEARVSKDSQLVRAAWLCRAKFFRGNGVGSWAHYFVGTGARGTG